MDYECIFNYTFFGKLNKRTTNGHHLKLDNVYYDRHNERSREKIVLEYTKAVDSSTINEEHRLKKKISEYEDKLQK
jgi:hypothetical protein